MAGISHGKDVIQETKFGMLAPARAILPIQMNESLT